MLFSSYTAEAASINSLKQRPNKRCASVLLDPSSGFWRAT